MGNFYELLHNITDLLKSEGRISYRSIKREFDLDDDLLEDLRMELVEVKQIARDIDGKMIELVSTDTGPKPAGTSAQGKIRPAAEAANEVVPPPCEARKASIEYISDDEEAIQENRKPVKKTLLIWLGAACILVGVLLPWSTPKVEVGGIRGHSGSATGLQLNHGLLSIAAGVFSALVGFVTARRTIPAKAVALSIIIVGVVVIGVTLDVISGGRVIDMGAFNQFINVGQTPEPGVFITLVGGGLLSLGGLVALIRARK